MAAEPGHDILAEGAISLSEGARYVNKSPPALWRWHVLGVNGIHLECVRLGRKILTSRPALTRFARALAERSAAECRQRQEQHQCVPAPAAAAPRAPAKARPTTARERDVAAARERLIRAGIIDQNTNRGADAA